MGGPAPKRADQRQRRNLRSTMATIEAESATKPSLPDLGSDPMSGAILEWHPLTRAWWETIWSSPISEEWVDADVPGLVALAQLVEDFWTIGKDQRTRAHAEVRMASREFGLSPFSRRQLQWEVRKIETAKPASVPSARRRPKTVLSVLESRTG